MSHLNESYYQTTDKEIVQDDWQRANERTGDPVEPDIFDLEKFAFDLLNQLGDEYGLYDDGSFTRAIWDANTPEEMDSIITQLQTALLMAMKSAAGL